MYDEPVIDNSNTQQIEPIKCDESLKRLRAAAEIIFGGQHGEKFWGLTFNDLCEKLDSGLNLHFPGLKNFVNKKPFGDVPIHAQYWQAPDIDYAEAIKKVSGLMLFGLHGPIACGKDTAADRLQAIHGFGRMGFADPLRSAASVLFCIPQDMFLNRDTKDREFSDIPCVPHSPRRMLQLLGTEVCRDIDSEVWTKRATLTMVGMAEQGVKNIAITDVRFPNESDYIHRLGGRLVVIDRPDVHASNTVLGAGHASQQTLSLSSGDLTLKNDTDIPAYWARVDEMRSMDLKQTAKKDRPRY